MTSRAKNVQPMRVQNVMMQRCRILVLRVNAVLASFLEKRVGYVRIATVYVLLEISMKYAPAVFHSHRLIPLTNAYEMMVIIM